MTEEYRSFKLSERFLEKYKNLKPPFGFNGLGELVYMRTYSRIKENGINEQWWETVKRVVEGTYNMQKRWIEEHLLGWNAHQAQYSAQEMYDRIFHMKFLPPGRGLWAMGSPITEERGVFAALNNCAFVSTETIKDDLSKPFSFLMDMSMLGVGVGFDTRGNGKILVKGINKDKSPVQFTIPDTREGWVQSVSMLIEHSFLGGPPIKFDYSKIRPAGELIKGFGGISSGHVPLEELHENIINVMERNKGEYLTTTSIVDLFNYIGKAVVAGNVRRCLPRFYEVFTDHGFKRLDEILVGDVVWTKSGNRRVSKIFNSGIQSVLKIRTVDGNEFEATKKHTFLVYDKKKKKFMWKMVKDINSKNDFFVKPKTGKFNG